MPYFEKSKYLFSQILELVMLFMGQNHVPQNVLTDINNCLGTWAIYFLLYYMHLWLKITYRLTHDVVSLSNKLKLT